MVNNLGGQEILFFVQASTSLLLMCSRKNFIHLYILLIAELGRKIRILLGVRFTDKSNRMIYFQLCVWSTFKSLHDF